VELFRRFGRPFLETREKWRTRSCFGLCQRNKPALYFAVKVAHPPISDLCWVMVLTKTGWSFHASRRLNILQVFLIESEIVPQFMDDCKADLLADFGLSGTNRFNILLVQNDVIGSRR